MVAAGALFLVLAAAAPNGAARLPGFTTPAPSVLAELRRRHRPNMSLRVTSGPERWSLRAHDLDERGLAGLTPGSGPLPPTDPFPWSRIERIDRVTDRRTYGRVMGGLVGGLGALLIPVVQGGWNEESSLRNFFLGGLVVGAVAGDQLGRRVVRERALYVAPFAEASPQVAEVVPPAVQAVPPFPSVVADSTATPDAVTPPRSVTDTIAPPLPATPPVLPVAPDAMNPVVDRALTRFGSENLLRIEGRFGTWHGYASRADASGLLGLRLEPSFASSVRMQSVSWHEIHRIDKRTSSMGPGAIRGAVVVGAAGATLGVLLGFAVTSLGGGDDPWVVAGCGAIGLGVGGGLGGLLGAAIGAGVPSWKNVYLRP
jgi:hypothetical protein